MLTGSVISEMSEDALWSAEFKAMEMQLREFSRCADERDLRIVLQDNVVGLARLYCKYVVSPVLPGLYHVEAWEDILPQWKAIENESNDWLTEWLSPLQKHLTNAVDMDTLKCVLALSFSQSCKLHISSAKSQVNFIRQMKELNLPEEWPYTRLFEQMLLEVSLVKKYTPVDW